MPGAHLALADPSIVSLSLLETPWSVQHFDTIDSTSLAAHRYASENGPGPIWFVASEQTAGKGRTGRQWVSKPGNLYSTALLPLQSIDRTVPVLALTIGLAVFDTFQLLSEGMMVPGLKWPNDVRVNQAKISGILLETGSLDNGQMWLSIGIGLNLVHSPSIEGYKTTNLFAETGKTVSPEQARSILDERVRQRLKQHVHVGVASIISDWTERSDQIGQRCRTTYRDGTIEGVFAGLDEFGQLRLRQDDGDILTITAGDVHLIRETSDVAGN